MKKFMLYDCVRITDKNSPYFDRTGVLCVMENEQYEVWLHTANGWQGVPFLKEHLEFER